MNQNRREFLTGTAWMGVAAMAAVLPRMIPWGQTLRDGNLRMGWCVDG